MPGIINLEQTFERWFNEIERFSYRSERFYWDFGPENFAILKECLKSAYLQGCRDTAQDACDTLRDYATALCGIEEKITRTEGYDSASDSLMVYFTEVLDNTEKENT